MNIEVNYLAILLAAVVSMAIGFLWYSPIMFAKPWMKLMGYTAETMKDEQKKMGKLYGLSFIGSLFMAFVLYHVMILSENYFHYAMLITGVSSAFWMWLGFVAPVQMTDAIFGSKKRDLFVINTGYQLASLMAMGITIGLIS